MRESLVARLNRSRRVRPPLSLGGEGRGKGASCAIKEIRLWAGNESGDLDFHAFHGAGGWLSDKRRCD